MADFSTLIKPASSLCNMRCKYCFYEDETSLRSTPCYGVMSRETAEKIIDRAYEFTQNGTVGFAFQGGEPTVAGLDYFTHFISYAKEKRPEKVKLNFSIQTNGLLINENWCKLLSENNFLVGLSMDGPRDINDFSRVDASGDGTFDRVMKTARLFKKHKVDFNILTVLTKQAARHPTQLWSFYKKNGFDFVQIIPCLAPLENPNEKFPYTLTPRDYADFLKTFFRIWSDELAKGNYISMRLFDNLVRMAMGQMPEMCGMMGSCSAQFVIEADGGVYPCDFYVLDEYKCGNVHESSFNEIGESQKVKSFLIQSLQKPSKCGGCKFFGICRGGCRRYREFYSLEKNYCPYADFLEYSHVRLANIAKILNENQGG